LVTRPVRPRTRVVCAVDNCGNRHIHADRGKLVGSRGLWRRRSSDSVPAASWMSCPTLLSRYFGRRALSTLYGLNWTAWGLAAATGPVLMGRAFDTTGSYKTVLVGFAAATLGAGILMLMLPAMKPPQVGQRAVCPSRSGDVDARPTRGLGRQALVTRRSRR
jgi:MFS family permease